MDKKKEFEARVRQLHAVDMNASQIYTDLSAMTDDKDEKEVLLSIARDENRHIAFSNKVIEILEGKISS